MFIPRIILNAFLMAIVASSALARREADFPTVLTNLGNVKSGVDNNNDDASALGSHVQEGPNLLTGAEECGLKNSDYDAFRKCLQRKFPDP
ncbi:hypothetical protein CVT25_013329 [Psilocybe cyanescens]|uniref:Uncharacterized protein n=1 Tax=Psilocybe cyanescens TaxID=93625 RepID=A0A409WSN7_PSICY|nr:hypothetical protein CVT25_013329 [Psilocybe cyanescens]